MSSLEQRNAFAVKNIFISLDAFPLVFRIFVAGFLCGKIALNNYNDVFFPLFTQPLPQPLPSTTTASLNPNLFHLPQPQPLLILSSSPSSTNLFPLPLPSTSPLNLNLFSQPKHFLSTSTSSLFHFTQPLRLTSFTNLFPQLNLYLFPSPLPSSPFALN